MKKILTTGLMMCSLGAISKPYDIQIPSDSNASYTVIDKTKEGSVRTVTTKRVGKSGVTYSKRAYDCKNREVKYLGSGETLEEMKSSKPDEKMAPITEGSIADYIGYEACKQN